jgi:hypothetical protein
MKQNLTAITLAILLAFLSACATLNFKAEGPLAPNETWGVVPLLNNTETPNVSERATAIAVSVLRARGVGSIELRSQEQRFDEGIARPQAVPFQEWLEWAKQRNVRYLITGSVTEWRYKVGLDGEPVAGVTMQVVEVPTGKVVWSAASGKSGWSREALSAVGQKVITGMLETLPLTP